MMPTKTSAGAWLVSARWLPAAWQTGRAARQGTHPAMNSPCRHPASVTLQREAPRAAGLLTEGRRGAARCLGHLIFLGKHPADGPYGGRDSTRPPAVAWSRVPGMETAPCAHGWDGSCGTFPFFPSPLSIWRFYGHPPKPRSAVPVPIHCQVALMEAVGREAEQRG